MANISDFKAQLATGGARPNQFRVILNFPQNMVGSLGMVAGRAVQFLCNATSLPASVVEDIPLTYRGRPVHFAGERVFQPWTITVYNTAEFDIRNALEAWQHKIAEYNTTYGIATPATYQSQMMVQQLDRSDKVLKSYQFIGAFPTNIGPIQLDFQQNQNIEQFDVEFTYDYFEPSNVAGNSNNNPFGL
jgi:hypothetical protein